MTAGEALLPRWSCLAVSREAGRCERLPIGRSSCLLVIPRPTGQPLYGAPGEAPVSTGWFARMMHLRDTPA